MTTTPTNDRADALLRHHAKDLADALEEAVDCLISCVKPAGGCDDEGDIARAIEMGDAALAAAGRLRTREGDGAP